ncbi:MAG: CPBP family intramembrane metalloprotease, partial [Clostridia bacterium]|nr:CPBP family intramembrane metalloprotease [Clostridia bacterium]
APGFDQVLLVASAAGVLITGCFLLSVLMGTLSAGQSFVLYDTFTSRQDGTTMGAAYLILAYAVLPAICEEVIFRGILCAEFEGRGVACAIAVSSILFSMLHFNLLAMPVYLFAGVTLALVLYTTRSVFCAVIVHFLYNLFCLFGQSGFTDFYVTQSATTLFLILMIAALLLCLAVFFGESSRLYRSYAKEGASDAYRPATKPTAAEVAKNTALAFASPGAILCVVLYLVVCIFR